MFHHHCDCHSVLFSLIRTFVFTIGHYFIDVSCTHFIAGAEWRLAMASGIVAPLLNAIWFFVLDRVFFGYILPKIKHKHKNKENI